MSLVEIKNNQVIVSSRQVAESFKKEHKDVLANIRDILAAEDSATKFFNESKFENRGKSYPMYLMNRDGFSLLVMGFTGKDALSWKIKYIQAFNEMENKLSFEVPQTFSQALLLAAKQAEQIESQSKQLIEAKPKVEFFDAVAGSKDAIEISSVAKVLGIAGMGRNNLFAFLRDKKILMSNNQPYQKYVDGGYFRVLEQKYEKPNGDTCINIKTLVFQKGVAYIKKLINDAENI